MLDTIQISSKTLETFLMSELETNKKQMELFKQSNNLVIDLLNESVVKNEDDTIKELTLIVCNPAELEILIQSLGARKKLLRGKIRNNEGHMKRMDLPSWTEKDFQTAIKKRKLQLAETDMLKTRIENL